jgi:hypothetical protein
MEWGVTFWNPLIRNHSCRPAHSNRGPEQFGQTQNPLSTRLRQPPPEAVRHRAFSFRSLPLAPQKCSIEQLTGVRKLALNQMGKSVRFPWLQVMTGLRELTILLGSRTGIEEVSHASLERLRIGRVCGIEEISLAAFPSLTHFHMEDQLKVQRLDLTALRSSLRWMTAWNCKSLENLVGIEAMNALLFLWIGKAKIDPEKVVPRLPASIRQATLAGYGKKRDAALSALIESRGIAPAAYGDEKTLLEATPSMST